MHRSRPGSFRSGALSGLVVAGLLGGACALPSLDQQQEQVRRGELALHTLTIPAFLSVWGEPTFDHAEYTQFFLVENGSYVPRFRVPLGEAPPGWDSRVVTGEARFLGYVPRGELLGFLDGRLVYRERMTAEDLRAVEAQWRREERFKTRLEQSVAPPSR